MNSEVKDTLLAFITGSIPATIVGSHFFDNVLWPIVMTVITGFIGGVAAILGKMFVNWIVQKFKK